MRILALVTDAFGGHGGIAQYNRHFLTALSVHPECEEIVAIPRVIQGPIGSLPEKVRFITGGVRGKASYLFAVLRAFLGRPRFDLIYCGHIHLLPLAWLVSALSRTPLVLQIYGIDAWLPTQSRLVNRLVTEADLCLAISRYTRTQFLKWADLPPHRVCVMPVSYTENQFSPGPTDADLLKRYRLENKQIILTVCRLVASERYKGVDEVMDAVANLASSVPDLAYLIVGDGDDRSRLEQKALALGIADRVVFAGSVTESEKAAHYQLADAFVMPSRKEGFGIVFLEAMACGIPVVAGNGDGSCDALRDGMLGTLVDAASPEEVQKGILYALSHAHGVPAGLDCFSFKDFCSNVHRILNTVLSTSLHPGKPAQLHA